jgi:predicted transcriptional regulator
MVKMGRTLAICADRVDIVQNVAHTRAMSDTMIPTWTIGDRMHKARRSSRIGSAEMADRIGATRATVSNYENGRTEPPIKVIQRWSEATGVPITWLIEGDDPEIRNRCFSAEIDQLELFANNAAVAA